LRIADCGFQGGRSVGGRQGQRLDLRQKIGADGNFTGGIFREGNSNGVAQAVAQKGADANGALDAPILAFAGFGHAEVDGIIPVRPQFLQAGHQEAVALDHHLGVAGLHGEFEVVVIVPSRDAGEFQRAFHHAQRVSP